MSKELREAKQDHPELMKALKQGYKVLESYQADKTTFKELADTITKTQDKLWTNQINLVEKIRLEYHNVVNREPDDRGIVRTKLDKEKVKELNRRIESNKYLIKVFDTESMTAYSKAIEKQMIKLRTGGKK